MKYTKDDLAKMSDFEVSKTICNLIGYDVNGVTEESNMMTGAVPDLSDWHYIMPLAVEHDVAYLRNYKSAYSRINGSRHDFMFTHESPQRAIACCLILVLQERE